ncbi:hypothetical protein PR001_g19268 [Phytophthora rubi]|uniref:Uncharacterized protein n=1 Tax=Phytophthora rubi TaxID=129364 RepID=A0A6A3JZC3_9STRA|nr:hypothetical protein PR002_g23367 [Phytophthora rubi]KAE8998658.1 hypothetical protein PR001_g19268 [Phytophthora rubi]
MVTRCTGLSLAAYTLSASTSLPLPSPSPSPSPSLRRLPLPRLPLHYPPTSLGESSYLRVVNSTGVSLVVGTGVSLAVSAPQQPRLNRGYGGGGCCGDRKARLVAVVVAKPTH